MQFQAFRALKSKRPPRCLAILPIFDTQTTTRLTEVGSSGVNNYDRVKLLLLSARAGPSQESPLSHASVMARTSICSDMIRSQTTAVLFIIDWVFPECSSASCGTGNFFGFYALFLVQSRNLGVVKVIQFLLSYHYQLSFLSYSCQVHVTESE